MAKNANTALLISSAFFLVSASASAQHRTSSAKVPPPAPLPSVAILPVDTGSADSVRAMLVRDLTNGDRVVVSDTAPVALRVTRTEAGLSASLADIASGVEKRNGKFLLPAVLAPRRDALRDSLATALNQRALAAADTLARDSVVRNGLLALGALNATNRMNTKQRAATRLAAAQRDSGLKAILDRRTEIIRSLQADSTQQDSILATLVRRDSIAVYRSNVNYRMAVHTMSDEIEMWLTGTRGIAATRIAYVHGPRLHLVDSDGADDEIVPTPGAALSPAWHPRATAIVYSDFTDDGTQIAEVNLATGETHLSSATRRGLNITPAFSPDGKSIVYASGGETPADLVLTDSDATQPPRLLGAGGIENSSPTFSPDGLRIAFISPRPLLTPQIYTMNLDGTGVKLLTPFQKGKRSYRTGPDWSPTGDAVAYEQQNGDFQVWMISLKTGKMTQLTKFAENEDPSWAPDGRHLAITSTRGGPREIWVLDTKTGHFRQLTHSADGGARLAAWSPYVRPGFPQPALAAGAEGTHR